MNLPASFKLELNITEMADAPPLQVPQILGSWRFLVALRLCRATYSEKSEISQHCLALGTWHFSFFECFLSVFCFQSCSLLAYFLGWWVTFTFFWGVETTKEFLSLLTQEFLWNDFCIFTVSMFFQALWAKYVTFAGLTSTAPVEVPFNGCLAPISPLATPNISQWLTSQCRRFTIKTPTAMNSIPFPRSWSGPKNQSKWGYSDHWAMAEAILEGYPLKCLSEKVVIPQNDGHFGAK